MPWTSEYHAAGAYITFTGRMTGEDLIQAKAEAYAHEYESGRPRFVVLDYVAVEQFDVDRGDVERTVLQDRDAESRELSSLLVAAVAPHAHTYGMARMWEARLEPTRWQTKVLRSRHDALGWLARHGVEIDRPSALQD